MAIGPTLERLRRFYYDNRPVSFISLPRSDWLKAKNELQQHLGTDQLEPYSDPNIDCEHFLFKGVAVICQENNGTIL